jgi:ADP-ribosylglycohydrolase
MPGYANWRTLYHDEYLQLYEEGYPVGESPEPGRRYRPFPEDVRDSIAEEEIAEADWERAYWNLWEVREQGLRPDFPFVEPDEYDRIIADAGPMPALDPLSADAYAERMQGAWYGRCAGVVLGKPLEMGLDRVQIKDYLESCNAYPLDDWVPPRSEKLGKTLRCQPSTLGNVRYVEPDDDVHYTILALLLVEKHELGFSKLDVCTNWLDNLPYHWVWSCTRQAYYHLVNMTDDRPREEQIAGFPTKLNPMREGINGAIRADLWGYINPGDPRAASALAHRESSVNCTKNGIYGAMFVAGCLGAALSKNPTVETILQGGFSVIPRRSRLAHALRNVIQWYREAGEWVPVCDKIYQHYGHLPFAGGINNLSFVVLSLLHGQLDFTRTITTAAMCGTDTDCTGGTAGSIVGAAIGHRGIDPRWVEPFNDTVHTVVADFGYGRISDLVRRTLDCYHTVHAAGQ